MPQSSKAVEKIINYIENPPIREGETFNGIKLCDFDQDYLEKMIGLLSKSNKQKLWVIVETSCIQWSSLRIAPFGIGGIARYQTAKLMLEKYLFPKDKTYATKQ